MADPFDDDFLDEIAALPKAEFVKFHDKLTPDERSMFEAALNRPRGSASPEIQPFTSPELPKAEFGPMPPRLKPGLLVQAAEGVSEAWNAPVDEAFGINSGPVGGVKKLVGVADAAIKPFKQAYVDPAIKFVQKAQRGALANVAETVGLDEGTLDRVVGPGVAQGARNLASLPLGDPQTYQSSAEYEEKQKALGEAGAAVFEASPAGMATRALGREDARTAAYPEQTIPGAAAQTLTRAYADLPLFLIPGVGKSPVAQGASIGALSGLVNTSEHAAPVQEAALGAVAGKVLGEAVPAAMGWLQREYRAVSDALTKGALKDLKLPEWVKGADSVAIVPSAQVSQIVEKVAVAERTANIRPPGKAAEGTANMRAGAKASMREGRIVDGTVEVRPLSIVDGEVRAGEWKPSKTSESDVVYFDNVTQAEVDALKAQGVLPKNSIIAADTARAEDLALAKAGQEVETVLMKETHETEPRVMFDAESETLGLDKLPDNDFLVARQKAGQPVEFKVVRARDIHAESLERRALVEIQTPEGPKLGFAKGVETEGAAKGQVVIHPPEAAEHLPRSLTESTLVDKGSMRFVDSKAELNRILTERAQIKQEAEDAILAAFDSKVAQQAAASGLPVIQTQAGPRVSFNAADGAPAPTPVPPGTFTPAQAAAVEPPFIMGGNGVPVPPGAPVPPAPPPPGGGMSLAVQRNLGKIVDFVIPPTSRGPRGLLDWGQSQALGDAVSHVHAAQDASPMVGRVFTHLADKQSKWVKQVKAGKSGVSAKQAEADLQAAIADVGRQMQQGDYSLRDFKLKYPEAAAEMDQFVQSWKALDNEFDARIKALDFHAPDMTPAPEGWERFMALAKADEPHLAQVYLAQTLGPKAVGQRIAADKAKFNRLLNGAKAEIRASSEGKKLTPGEIEERAVSVLEDFLHDPKSKLGSAKALDKLAHDLRVFERVVNAWGPIKGVGTTATDYVRGAIDKSKLVTNLERQGVALAEKDLAFLTEFRRKMDQSLTPWQREALGHVVDPMTNMAFSVGRRWSELQRAEAMGVMRNSGMIMSESELRAIHPNFRAEGWSPVPNDPQRFGRFALKGDPMSPVPNTNYFIHPDATQPFLEYDEGLKAMKEFVRAMRSGPLSGVMLANDMRKLALTVGNPGAWGSNIFSNLTSIALKAGIGPVKLFRHGGFADAISHWKGYAANPLAVGGDAAWIREGIARGMIGSDSLGREVAPLLQALARDPSSVNSFSGFARFLTALPGLGKGVRKGAEIYSAIDSIAKYGSWLTMLKSAGVDLKTGAVDAAALDLFVNGRRAAVFGPRTPLPTNPAELLDFAKQVAQFRVNRAFALPDRAARVPEASRLAANATLGTVTGDFAHVAAEEARSWGMFPYRLATEPGVAGAVAGWGMVAAGAAGLLAIGREALGLSDENIRKSQAAMPVGAKTYTPALVGLMEVGPEGQVANLDLSRFFEPLRWAAGDYLGRPLDQQLHTSPGQLFARLMYNASIGQLGGSLTGPATDKLAQGAGLDVHQKWNASPAVRGVGPVAEALYNWAAPPVVKDIVRAQDIANDAGPNNIPAWAPLVNRATLGAVKVTGAPGRAHEQEKKEEGLVERRDQQRALSSQRNRDTTTREEKQDLRQEKRALKKQVKQEKKER